MRFFLISSIAALCLLGSAHSAVTRARDFVGALEAAKEHQQVCVVLAHGSSWQLASENFLSQVWDSQKFRDNITEDTIITEIHFKQNLDKEQKKLRKKKTKGWDPKQVNSYPAVQIFSPSGKLVHTLEGRSLRSLQDPSHLAAYVNLVTKSLKQRELLYRSAHEDEKAGKKDNAISKLITAGQLPLKHDSNLSKRLTKLDPKNQSGWKTAIAFDGWKYFSSMKDRAEKESAKSVIEEIGTQLTLNEHTPSQRSFLYASLARVHALDGNLSHAWLYYNQARSADPHGPVGKAMYNYGKRTVGRSLRAVAPAGSDLNPELYGANISSCKATFKLSSSSKWDTPSDHARLFSGAPSSKGLAFHTASQKGAHLVIDLTEPCDINALCIVNRQSRALHKRTVGLTIWTSLDGKTWKQVWQTQEAKPLYDVVLQESGNSPAKARYLKVGLPKNKKDYLHLHTIDIWGKRYR